MGSFTITHWIVVAIVVLVLFGRGKISETMGDFGKGIRSFRQGMNEAEKTAPPAQITASTQTPAAAKAPESKDA